MRFLAFAFLAFLPFSAVAAPVIGQPAPDFTTTAIEGEPVKLSDYAGKIVVLEWNNPQCPFVHKHYDSGNMQKLQAYAHGKGVVWLTVNSSGDGKEGNINNKQALDYVQQNKLTVSHYILDPKGTLGKLYEAKTTPHMFVINGKGNVVYMGAIDNKPSAEQKDITGADNYVRDAIDALLTRKPIKVVSSQSYGCAVKYAD